jgi:peptide/histidine transporter 3/4
VKKILLTNHISKATHHFAMPIWLQTIFLITNEITCALQDYAPYICNGSVDIRGNPASKIHTGKWRACYSILGNRNLISYGIQGCNAHKLFPLIFWWGYINSWVWNSFFFTVGEFCGSLAYYGIGTNLVSYLSNVQQQSNIDAASNIAFWHGTC